MAERGHVYSDTRIAGRAKVHMGDVINSEVPLSVDLQRSRLTHTRSKRPILAAGLMATGRSLDLRVSERPNLERLLQRLLLEARTNYER